MFARDKSHSRYALRELVPVRRAHLSWNESTNRMKRHGHDRVANTCASRIPAVRSVYIEQCSFQTCLCPSRITRRITGLFSLVNQRDTVPSLFSALSLEIQLSLDFLTLPRIARRNLQGNLRSFTFFARCFATLPNYSFECSFARQLCHTRLLRVQ